MGDPNQRTFNVLTAGKIDEMNIEFVKETSSEGRCPRRNKLYKVRDKSYLIRSFLKGGAPKGTTREDMEEHYVQLAEHYEQLAAYHREKHSKFMKGWWASRSPEEAAARKKKLVDATRKWRENMTPDERKAESKNKSDAQKKCYENIKANKPPQPPIRDPFFHYKEEMCDKMPDIPNQKRSAIIKKQWKDLDPQKKKLYQDQVDRDIAKYEEELIQYNQRIQ